jgi:hypothetical protein
MLKKTLFFVHIPKTGGTSLRKAIEEKVGEENSFYDYGPHSNVTSPLILEQRYKLKNIRGIEDALSAPHNRLTLLCGHTRASIYSSIISPCNIITFLRNPIDRVVSHYEHLRRHNNYHGSLEEFCVKPHFRNIQSKSLQGYPLELVGFVGITDLFEESIALFKDQFDLSIEELELNKNDKKSLRKKYNLTPETINLISQNNLEDIILYEKAKALFKSKYLLRDLKAYNIYGNVDLLNGSSVSGWCFIKNSEDNKSSKIEILKNKRVIGTVETKTLRPTLKSLNIPKNGIVGFNYRFSTTPKTDDIFECRVLGSQYILPGVKSYYRTK